MVGVVAPKMSTISTGSMASRPGYCGSIKSNSSFTGLKRSTGTLIQNSVDSGSCTPLSVTGVVHCLVPTLAKLCVKKSRKQPTLASILVFLIKRTSTEMTEIIIDQTLKHLVTCKHPGLCICYLVPWLHKLCQSATWVINLRDLLLDYLSLHPVHACGCIGAHRCLLGHLSHQDSESTGSQINTAFCAWVGVRPQASPRPP